MDFHFTEEQKILQKTARDFLQSECPSSFVLEMEADEKGYRPELWNKMAELGWMALIIPEEYEGVGGNLLDLVVMLEEVGRFCLPGPFFSTVLGCLSIMEAGSKEQQKELLPKVGTGESILTMALSEPGNRKYDPFLISVEAEVEKNDFIINGTKLFVSDAHVADYLVCAARTSDRPGDREGVTLFMVDSKTPGIRLTPMKTLAGDKQFEVDFQGVAVPGDHLLGPLNQGGVILEQVLQKGTICKCAEMLGGAQKVLEMATGYAKEREQFGRPIGSFQAVQHHCSNMLMDIEGSRYITYKVAWMLEQGIPCAKQVSAAKAWISEAYKRVVGLGHQIMGATGYIIEHDMPLYSRRAKIAELALGDAGFHREQVARELGL
ncbi:MAG: acyl-CoA/acyl-ACP dehydrogenase [Deltaproteobacteria bacterium]|nr:acyl-CoA/acyl-ACP dehydrogenase [Deltaproteobacteria bacterium]MBW1941329.1 acyl-CoA/acyl-ACP dehydrogenase [Deltaproteobacteria bacterium]MBW2207705.1 acyl-CoA/acyl-ACP dehydrogenase [Deltaproteobacteria bacterium]